MKPELRYSFRLGKNIFDQSYKNAFYKLLFVLISITSLMLFPVRFI
ncbi:hypothetical protein SAMN04488524_4405 [Pedobacter africanus]|uniref:Uncharacterized protein n=1 Tax=Pedobacter africanus TaxID=151894 RepID=A0A1W2E254_9SPHI|nr:hypothetical protein SAMN04488524_4405 [Pedobacter africanus]